MVKDKDKDNLERSQRNTLISSQLTHDEDTQLIYDQKPWSRKVAGWHFPSSRRGKPVTPESDTQNNYPSETKAEERHWQTYYHRESPSRGHSLTENTEGCSSGRKRMPPTVIWTHTHVRTHTHTQAPSNKHVHGTAVWLDMSSLVFP